MSNNIRGINDIRNNNRNQGGYGNSLRNMNFFTSDGSNQKDPRSETFWDMLHINICPQLVFYSFSVIFVLFIIAMFIVQLAVDGIDKADATKLQSQLLPININKPNGFSSQLLLSKEDVKSKFQVYRLLTSLVIHADFIHILFNSIAMIIWTSYFEIFLTSKKMIINFFLSGIVGDAFSLAVQPGTKSLGASTGIYGIMGCAAAFLIFNWNNLDYEGSPRFMWTCQVVFITIMSFLFQPPGVNIFSHLGGYLAGVLIGLFLCERHQRPGGQSVSLSQHEKTWKIVGMVASIVMFGVCMSFVMFA